MRVDEEGIPPGHAGYDLTYSETAILRCPRCGAGQIGIYRHDCFDPEDLFDQYDWYVLDAADSAELAHRVGACPQPLSPGCGCPVHAALRESCRALPVFPWIGRDDEASWHVHRAELKEGDGPPRVGPRTSGAGDRCGSPGD